MLVVGANLIPPLKVSLGQFIVPDSAVTVIDTVNFTSFRFELPAGSGVGLTLMVATGGTSSPPLVNALSYALPNVSGIAGCGAVVPSNTVLNCSRTGRDLLTIIGNNFGPGQVKVLLSGLPCSNEATLSADTRIVCVLPPMPIGRALANQLIIIQASGGLYIAPLATAAVSYTPCPAGQFEIERSCSPCPIGTYSALQGSLSCTPCPEGKYGATGGLSVCMACLPGTYWSTANHTVQCLPCPIGKFNIALAQVQCQTCLANTFNDAAGLSSPCLTCPPGSKSSAGSAVCSCESGFYLSSSFSANSTCLACPLGASCIDSSAIRTAAFLASTPGYWRVPSAPALASNPIFMACPLGGSIACPSSTNGTCGLGYTGVLCGTCAVGFHASGLSCIPCEGATKFALVIVLVVAAAVLALLYWFSTKLDLKKMVNCAKLAVSCACFILLIIFCFEFFSFLDI
jgi:hypothetical protein